MPEKVANIAKNTSYFTLALVLQKVISFTYFTLLARNLPPESLGKYYFAISFTTIFAIFIDLGTANVLTREVAKDQARAGEWLSGTLFLKIPLTVLAVGTAVLAINLLDYPALTRNLVYLSIICMVLDSYSVAFFAAIRGFHNLIFESISSILFQLIALSFGLTALRFGLGLTWVMAALVAASSFMFVYSFALVVFKWRLRVLPRFDPKLISTIVRITIPFAVFGVFQRLYLYLDSALLSILAGDRYVGLYQVPFKIIFALQFLPMAFVASLYPAFASYWRHNREQLDISFDRSMNYLLIISLPISLGIFSLADKIVLIFKSGYAEAVTPLRIIILALPFLFLNFPVGSLLNACDRQKRNTLNIGITLAASIILNLLLIPRYQAVGASITVLVTNILMFTLGLSYVPALVNIRARKLLLLLSKVLISAALMSVAAFLLKSYLNIFVVVVCAGAVYFITLYLFRGFTREDIASILKSFSRKSNP